MPARNRVPAILIAATLLGIGLGLAAVRPSPDASTLQLATRYHARNRTANFYERAADSNARTVVTGKTETAKPVHVPARSIRRR